MFEQEGQKSLLQVIVEDSCERRCFLSFVVKVSLWRIIFRSSGKAFHNLGRWKRGKRESWSVQAKGMWSSLSFLSCLGSSSNLLSWFDCQVTLRACGRYFCLKCCINWVFENSARRWRGRISRDLNRGSVWALYGALEMILMAFFWSFEIESMLLTLPELQICTAYNRWLCKSAKYKEHSADSGKMFFTVRMA